MSAVTKTIGLRTSNGRLFWVDPVVAFESLTIKKEVDRLGTGVVINVFDVTGPILENVIEYCKKHIQEPKDFDELKVWDANFITVDHNVLFDLMLAARYLKIQGLLDLTSEAIKYMVEGKSSDEICNLLNIPTT